MDLVVIADEVTALGWRLAGARVLTPEKPNMEDCFRTALTDAEMVIITADLASALPAIQLQDALHSYPPLLLVIPDLPQMRAPPDLEAESRRALGVGV